MSRRLELCLTIMILVGVIGTVVNLVRFNSIMAAFVTARQGDSKAVNIGEKITVLADDSSLVKRTLLLVLNPGCHFCEDSFPFYRRLAHATHGRRDVLLAVATSLPSERGLDYVRSAKLDIDKVVTISPGSFGFRGTPTILLLDKRTFVVRSWIGRLSASQESEVERAADDL